MLHYQNCDSATHLQSSIINYKIFAFAASVFMSTTSTYEYTSVAFKFQTFISWVY